MGTLSLHINRFRSHNSTSKAVFLCPSKVPCRIKDPNRLKGALLFSGNTNRFNHGGKDMRNKGHEVCTAQIGDQIKELEVRKREYSDETIRKTSNLFRQHIQRDLQVALSKLAVSHA